MILCNYTRSEVMMNSRILSLLGGSFVILALTVAGCEPNYEKVVREELRRGERYDSIVYGVRLGMSYDAFTRYCFAQNQRGVFKPNETGNAVQVAWAEGFGFPVKFEFFPTEVTDKFAPIRAYQASVRYRDYSLYNPEMTVENLLPETLAFFEQGYGGRDFLRVPQDDPWVKYRYVKVDGNRRIIIVPTHSGDELTVQFQDLSPLNESGENLTE